MVFGELTTGTRVSASLTRAPGNEWKISRIFWTIPAKSLDAATKAMNQIRNGAAWPGLIQTTHSFKSTIQRSNDPAITSLNVSATKQPEPVLNFDAMRQAPTISTREMGALPHCQ